MDTHLTYLYPANFSKADREIFYFLDSTEKAPTFHLTTKNNCYWDAVRERTIAFSDNLLSIALAYVGIRKKLLKVKRAVWITDHYSNNYFHWFNDALPKLIFLEEEGIRGEVLLLEHLANIGFIKQSIELLGWTYKVITLNTICHVEEMFLPSITDGNGAQHPYYFKTLCSKFTTTEQVPHRKIFISRENCSNRNVIPQQQFKDLLLLKGVEVVSTENLSLKEQIDLFKQCSHLIAVHGAGLTNMAFMPFNKGNVLELRRNDDKINYCYFKMANVLHHKYSYYLGEAEAIEKTVQADNLKVNLDAIERVVDKFLQD